MGMSMENVTAHGNVSQNQLIIALPNGSSFSEADDAETGHMRELLNWAHRKFFENEKAF
jgi:hypothetical protein